LNKDFDIVVVGTGNAALCSAIAAGEKGAKVLVVEKGPKNKRGGNSFFTDGAMRFAYKNIKEIRNVVPELINNHLQNICIPPYSETYFYNDLMRVTQGKSDPYLAQHLVNNSYSTILWLNKQGVKFELNESQYFKKGNTLKFWGGLPLRTKNKGIGLVNSLFNKSESLDIEIKYETKAVELMKDNGKIEGIVVEDKNNNIYNINAKAVILACGGFEASKLKRAKFLGNNWKDVVVRGCEYNTGDGIEMALEAGGQRAGQYDGCHAHVTDYNAPKVGNFKKPGDIYKKSSYPLGLIINKFGKRFVDEGADFRNFTYAKYGKETLNQPEKIAYQIFDSQIQDKLRDEYNLEEATVLKANDINKLAEKMEIDIKSFNKTIKEYNNSVQEGLYDPSIKDGKSTKNLYPAKSNWALKFEKPPFYAYPVTCGITFTFGGLWVNDKSEVLNQFGNPIIGLYAAGEIVGDLFYHNYPGGSGLMSGAVFGKTAGENAFEATQKS